MQSAYSGPICYGREVCRQSGKWAPSTSGGSQDRISDPTATSPQRSYNCGRGPDLGGRPSSEMSSVQVLMELALPRFAMMEGPVMSILSGRLRQNHRRRRH